MAEVANHIPITQADLVLFSKKAEVDLREIEWKPKRQNTLTPSSSTPLMLGINMVGVEPPNEKISLWKVASDFCGGETILSEPIHHVLVVLKKAIQIGLHLESLYVKSSGVDVLEKQNTAGSLPDSQKIEFNAKQTTKSAVMLYSLASYIVWELAGYRTEEVSNVSMETPNITELPLTSSVSARKSTFFYLGRGLSDENVNTDIAFVKYTLLYFREIIAEIKLREGQFQFSEPFTERKYKLEKTEFIIDGFEDSGDKSVISVEFNRVSFSEIVGNRVAKHNSMRTIARMLCYDLERKNNPMRELGGLAPVRLGKGVPGTGKSMTIAAIATELFDRAKWIGLPFLFHPLPDAIVSTYQGGSAERMMAWMHALRDPSKLIYAPIDDAENSFENRTRQGVSSGVREVIAVFLRNTEGAYAINRGNTLIDICTNLPEQIDPAVMSRIVERYEIAGAVSAHDFIDQDHSWWKRYAGMSKDFIDMKDPTNYGYFDDQKPMTSISKEGERYTTARNSDIQEILRKTLRDNDPKNQQFFGVLYQEVKKVFPGFSSRDLRNIQGSITGRMLDFDFPSEWLDEPTHFFLDSYESKKDKLTELLRANMKGISFQEIRLEEALRYLDTMAEIANVDFERQVGRTVEAMSIQNEASKRFNAKP